MVVAVGGRGSAGGFGLGALADFVVGVGCGGGFFQFAFFELVGGVVAVGVFGADGRRVVGGVVFVGDADAFCQPVVFVVGVGGFFFPW